MPVKAPSSASPKRCDICGGEITDRHKNARICWTCYKKQSMTRYQRRDDYYITAQLNLVGFKGCEDCRRCKKYGCRHNPKNPARLAG